MRYFLYDVLSDYSLEIVPGKSDFGTLEHAKKRAVKDNRDRKITWYKDSRFHTGITAYKGFNEHRELINIITEGGLRNKKKNPSKRFTASQLATLRKEYARIKSVDPEKPTYRKITNMLDTMTQSQLKQLANARIKFVSGLARNRVRNKNPMKKLKAGSKLKNGATVLGHDPKTGTVLAHWPTKNEFVTWRIDEDKNAYWGHYFKTIEAATRDYEKRTKAKVNPTMKKKTAKKKRSAKQLANDRRLGRMAKARAKKKTTRKRSRSANPKKKRTTRAKSHLWRVFKCKGNDVRYMAFMTNGKLRWTLTRGDAALFSTKKQATFAAKGMLTLRGSSVSGWHVGIAPYEKTGAQIAAECKGGK